MGGERTGRQKAGKGRKRRKGRGRGRGGEEGKKRGEDEGERMGAKRSGETERRERRDKKGEGCEKKLGFLLKR